MFVGSVGPGMRDGRRDGQVGGRGGAIGNFQEQEGGARSMLLWLLLA